MKTVSLAAVCSLAAVANLGAADKFSAAMDAHHAENPEMVLYMNLDGSAAKLAGWIGRIYASYLAANPEAMPLPLDFEMLFKHMGLTALDHALITSAPAQHSGAPTDGAPVAYVNEATIGLSGAPTGLLALFGSENLAFDFVNTVPADSDMVAEIQFRPQALVDMVRAAATDVMGQQGAAIIDRQLDQPLSQDGLTIRSIIETLDTRYRYVANVDPEGDRTGAVVIPGYEGDHVIVIEGAAGLIEQVAPLLPPTVDLARLEGDPYGAWRLMVPQAEAEPAALLFTPMPDSSDLMISSGEAARAWFMGDRTGLAANEAFSEMAAQLPRSGLSFWYTSEAASRMSLKQIKTAAASDDPEMAEMKPFMDMLMEVMEVFVGENASASWVEEGRMRSKSIQPYSTKTALGMAFAVVPGVVAVTAIPAFQRVQATSQEKMIINNLRQIASAGQQYLLDTGADSVTYAELVAEGYFPPIDSVAGEYYDDIEVSLDTMHISVTLPSGEEIGFDF